MARHHGDPARARVHALCDCQLPRSQISGDTRLESVSRLSPASHPRGWLIAAHVSNEAAMGGTSMRAGARDPAELLALGQGLISGFDAHPGCRRQVPGWTEAPAGPAHPAGQHTMAQREAEKARKVESVPVVLLVSPAQPFALPRGNNLSWGHCTEKALWKLVLCVKERTLIQ